MSLTVKTFYDEPTFTLSYFVYDENTKDAILIDPVLDYDPASGAISTDSIENYKSFISDKKLKLHYILETHAHADHLSGAHELRENFPEAKIAIGKNITLVQEVFSGVFNMDVATDGSQFDLLLDEGEPLKVGSFEVKTIFTPGHTPACASYLIEDNLFTGDALFMPDFGTGRCDFPKGSAEDLYNSVSNKIYELPDETKVYVGHDYQPNGRKLEYQTTVGESKKKNIQLKSSTTKEEFVKFRTERDATLSAPKLLLPSVQVNITAGELPNPESNGTRYLKIPLSQKRS